MICLISSFSKQAVGVCRIVLPGNPRERINAPLPPPIEFLTELPVTSSLPAVSPTTPKSYAPTWVKSQHVPDLESKKFLAWR